MVRHIAYVNMNYNQCMVWKCMLILVCVHFNAKKSHRTFFHLRDKYCIQRMYTVYTPVCSTAGIGIKAFKWFNGYDETDILLKHVDVWLGLDNLT